MKGAIISVHSFPSDLNHSQLIMTSLFIVTSRRKIKMKLKQFFYKVSILPSFILSLQLKKIILYFFMRFMIRLLILFKLLARIKISRDNE